MTLTTYTPTEPALISVPEAASLLSRSISTIKAHAGRGRAARSSQDPRPAGDPAGGLGRVDRAGLPPKSIPRRLPPTPAQAGQPINHFTHPLYPPPIAAQVEGQPSPCMAAVYLDRDNLLDLGIEEPDVEHLLRDTHR